MRTELEVCTHISQGVVEIAVFIGNALQARLAHISPAELLLPEDGLSKSTERMLAHYAAYAVLAPCSFSCPHLSVLDIPIQSIEYVRNASPMRCPIPMPLPF
jgi:hypothetical protein